MKQTLGIQELPLLQLEARYDLASHNVLHIALDPRHVVHFKLMVSHCLADLFFHIRLMTLLLKHVRRIQRIMTAPHALDASSGNVCLLQHLRQLGLLFLQQIQTYRHAKLDVRSLLFARTDLLLITDHGIDRFHQRLVILITEYGHKEITIHAGADTVVHQILLEDLREQTKKLITDGIAVHHTRSAEFIDICTHHRQMSLLTVPEHLFSTPQKCSIRKQSRQHIPACIAPLVRQLQKTFSHVWPLFCLFQCLLSRSDHAGHAVDLEPFRMMFVFLHRDKHLRALIFSDIIEQTAFRMVTALLISPSSK